MGHEIDLKGKLPRTDLAIDLIDENQKGSGFTKDVKQYQNCKVTNVNILKTGSKKIGKEYTGDVSNPENAGERLAEMVLAAGGDEILKEIYS